MDEFGWDSEDGLPNIKPFRDLRKTMATCFSLDDLRVIAFDLQFDWDEIAGATKTLKIVELINLVYRQDRLRELLGFLKEERPDIDWHDVVKDLQEQNAKVHMEFDYVIDGMVHGGRVVTAWGGRAISSIPLNGEYYDDGLAFAEAIGSVVDHFYTFEVEKKGDFAIENITVSIRNMDYRVELLDGK